MRAPAGRLTLLAPNLAYLHLVLHVLGTVKDALGQLDAAHETLARALKIRRACLGDERLDVAYTRQELANVLLAQGHPGASLSLRSRRVG